MLRRLKPVESVQTVPLEGGIEGETGMDSSDMEVVELAERK